MPDVPHCMSRWMKLAIGVHAVASVWILGNGVAHEIGVAVRHARGTLSHPEHVVGLLAVGIGLMVVGTLMALGIRPLARGRAWPALASLVALAGLLAIIFAHYGAGVLAGSTFWGTLDLAAILAALRFTPLRLK